MSTENNQEAQNGNLDTESNLFDTIDNGTDYDTDSDDDIRTEFQLERSFEEFEENDDDDQGPEEDDENDDLFGNDDDGGEDDDDNDDDQSTEFNEKELEVLNKKLGTDFKSVEDLKKSFNAKDQETEQQKEDAEHKRLSNNVGLFERYIAMDNESLIREQLLSEASNAKRDITDPDVIEEIEEKIEGLKDLKTLDSMADTLRSNLKNQMEKTQSSIQQIDDKRILSQQEIARKNTDDLQNAFTDIFTQGKFLGMDVTKQDIQDAYESVRTNKFFESVNGNQEMIAKFAMFVKYEKEISKLSNKPTHSDKVKDEFNFLAENAGKQRRSITQANGSASSGNAKDDLLAFLK